MVCGRYQETVGAVHAALCDNFNTPIAIAALRQLMGSTYRYLQSREVPSALLPGRPPLHMDWCSDLPLRGILPPQGKRPGSMHVRLWGPVGSLPVPYQGEAEDRNVRLPLVMDITRYIDRMMKVCALMGFFLRIANSWSILKVTRET